MAPPAAECTQDAVEIPAIAVPGEEKWAPFAVAVRENHAIKLHALWGMHPDRHTSPHRVRPMSPLDRRFTKT